MSEAAHDRTEASRLPEGDVIRILLEQHARIRALFAELKASPADDRGDLFRDLRALLAVHETAEELVLRPAADGEAWKDVADERNAEEKEANEVLAELERLDPSSDAFLATLESFEKAVDQHAEAEENEEFPRVLSAWDEDRRQTMGGRLLSVQHMAPTRPHPAAAGSPAAVALTGPFAAMVDRVRDALSG
jgi:hemerythrin superfamily protein